MRAEILVGPERRRRWSSEEKSRIVAEASAPGAKVAEVARRHDVSRNLIYSWRRAASRGFFGDGVCGTLPDLVPVVVSDAGDGLDRVAVRPPSVSADEKRRAYATAATTAEGAIEVAFAGDVRVTIRGRVEERTLRAVLRALRPA